MSDNKNIVKRFNQDFIANVKMDAFNDLISPDFINHTAPPGSPTNKEAFLAFFNNVLRTAFSDIRIEIHDQIEENYKVVTRKTIRCTHSGVFMGHPPTGRPLEIKVTDIVRLEHGQYVEHWGSADMLGAIAQITAPAI